MAEEKKDKKDKKDAKPAGWNFDSVEILILLLIFITLFTTLGPSVKNFVTSGEITFFGIRLSSVIDFLSDNLWIFKSIAFGIAGVSAVAVFVFNRRADAIWRAEIERLTPPNIPKTSEHTDPVLDPVASKWAVIVEKSESTDENNWRVAIIEADIILDSLLEQLNLPGQTIGEKLKAVEPSDFLTLDNAWEAHKARNMIAHEGTDFLIDQREVRRVIRLYESVFREFHLI